MKKVIIFTISVFPYILYSQDNIRDYINFINENKLFKTENKKIECDSIIYTNNFNFSKLNYESALKNDKESKFKLYFKNNELIFIQVTNEKILYDITVTNFNNDRLLVFQNAYFAVIRNEKILFFDTKIDIFYDEINLIKGLNSVYYVDFKFNPIRSFDLNDEFIISSSVFTLKRNKIIEDIIFEKSDFKNMENCYNIFNKKINLIFFKLEDDFYSVCSYYKKFKIVIDSNPNTFLWFINRKQKI